MAIQFEPQQEQPQPQQEKTYKVGDTFLYKNEEPYMIIKASTDEVILSRLTDGLRWDNGVKVSDSDEITQSEFDKLTYGQSSEFAQRDFKIILI